MDNMWTPYLISIVLHHHTTRSTFERASAPLYGPSVDQLCEQGIFHFVDGIAVTTDKGKALVDMWCKTPLPEQKWSDPRFDNGDSHG